MESTNRSKEISEQDVYVKAMPQANFISEDILNIIQLYSLISSIVMLFGTIVVYLYKIGCRLSKTELLTLSVEPHGTLLVLLFLINSIGSPFHTGISIMSSFGFTKF